VVEGIADHPINRAHRFYFSEGLAVVCFNFSKDLAPQT
jgi:hypothetical protein